MTPHPTKPNWHYWEWTDEKGVQRCDRCGWYMRRLMFRRTPEEPWKSMPKRPVCA